MTIQLSLQGKPFHWDSSSVVIATDATGAGYVDFEGVWDHDQNKYKVRMIPTPASKPGGSNGLKVSARRASPGGGSISNLSEPPSPPSCSSTSSSGCEVGNNIVPAGAGSGIVAQGLAQMFTQLQLNLQGIELSKPALKVLVEEGQEPMLEITMKLKVRSLPPLNMEF